MNNIIIPFRANLLESSASPFENLKSIIFDGSDDYLNAGQPTVFDNATNFSISTWFKTSSTILQGLYTYLPATQTQGWIELNFDSTIIRVNISDSTTSFGYTSFGPSLNTWYNVTIVYNGSGAANADRLKFYVDGVDTALTFQQFSSSP